VILECCVHIPARCILHRRQLAFANANNVWFLSICGNCKGVEYDEEELLGWLADVIYSRRSGERVLKDSLFVCCSCGRGYLRDASKMSYGIA